MLIPHKRDSLFFAFLKTLGILFFFITAGLLLDSKFVIPHFPEGQILANIIILVFIPLYLKPPAKCGNF